MYRIIRSRYAPRSEAFTLEALCRFQTGSSLRDRREGRAGALRFDTVDSGIFAEDRDTKTLAFVVAHKSASNKIRKARARVR